MHGEKEQQILAFVQEHLNQAQFYGISAEDVCFLRNAILSAKPNTEPSQFPDFVFDSGFIEHFQITSSKSNSKGSSHNKNFAEHRKKVDAEIREVIEKRVIGDPNADNTRSWPYSFKGHSHKNLLESLQKIWNKHMISLEKYEGEKGINIFLISYEDQALATSEVVHAKEGLCFGDLIREEKFKDYRLSRDKKALDYLYAFREKISYVIYCCNSAIEIISIEHIPEIKAVLQNDFQIYPLCAGIVTMI